MSLKNVKQKNDPSYFFSALLRKYLIFQVFFFALKPICGCFFRTPFREFVLILTRAIFLLNVVLIELTLSTNLDKDSPLSLWIFTTTFAWPLSQHFWLIMNSYFQRQWSLLHQVFEATAWKSQEVELFQLHGPTVRQAWQPCRGWENLLHQVFGRGWCEFF